MFVCFVDYCSAFDKANYCTGSCLERMIDYGVNSCMVKILVFSSAGVCFMVEHLAKFFLGFTIYLW